MSAGEHDALGPHDVHALVVGIEKYATNERWNLSGPALDAARFVQWLRDRKVPPENICLLAVPLEGNRREFEERLAPLGVQCKAPESEAIREALTVDFAKRPGKILFVFWGGHGVTAAGRRRLFPANVRDGDLRSIDFEKLRGFCLWKMTGFKRQAFFVDTCANYSFDLVDVDLPSGEPRGKVSQFVLFSVGEGQLAKNLDALRTGLFSSVLLDELEKEPKPLEEAVWPPDLPAVQQRVQARFVELREAGKANQTPTFLLQRDWDGNETIPYAPMRPELGPREIDLVDALSDFPAMDSPDGRNKVLGELRGRGVKEVDKVVSASDKRLHLEYIVSVLTPGSDETVLIELLLEKEERGAHVERLARVKLEREQQLFNPDTIAELRALLLPLALDEPAVQRIFKKAARGIENPGDLHDAYLLLMSLASNKKYHGFRYPALVFADKLTRILPTKEANELREIVRRVAKKKSVTNDLEDLRNSPAWNDTSETATLVFEMRTKAGGLSIRASLLDENATWTRLATDDHPVGEDDAKRKFRELVGEAEGHAEKLIIEMVVPREMFCWPIDRWEIDVGGYPVTVGAHYPVVLRWMDRLRDQRLQRRWNEKWKVVTQHAVTPLWLRKVNEFQPAQLLAKLAETPLSGAFVTFAFPPPQAPERRADELTVALSGGTPVAIWWRECDPDPQVAEQELQSLLTHRSLDELPEVLRVIRNRAEVEGGLAHAGCRLGLMYDNPGHVPPELADSIGGRSNAPVAHLQRQQHAER